MYASSIVKYLLRLRADERGAVSVIMGLLLIPLAGGLALGFEISKWYIIRRGFESAADTAAVAAATNGGFNSDVEAEVVAAQYGFVDGINSISVAVSNTA